MAYVARATRRTFYLERTGQVYTVVKVWEAGARFDPADVQRLMQRVLTSDPDERIIAEQSYAIDRTGPDLVMTAESQALADVANRAAQAILRGEDMRPAEEPRPPA